MSSILMYRYRIKLWFPIKQNKMKRSKENIWAWKAWCQIWPWSFVGSKSTSPSYIGFSLPEFMAKRYMRKRLCDEALPANEAISTFWWKVSQNTVIIKSYKKLEWYRIRCCEVCKRSHFKGSSWSCILKRCLVPIFLLNFSS